jgi:hypothetical protein
LTEPTRVEEKSVAYSTEIQEVMGGGYNENGAPWRLATERKTVGIGEYVDRGAKVEGPIVAYHSVLSPEYTLHEIRLLSHATC